MSSITSRMPSEAESRQRFIARRARGERWRLFFLSSILIGMVILLILLFSILNQTFGLVAVRESIPEAVLSDRPLAELEPLELTTLLKDNLSKGRLQALFINEVTGTEVDRARLGSEPLNLLIPDRVMSEETGAKTFTELTPDDLGQLLADNVGKDRLLDLVYQQVVGLETVQSWPLLTSLFNRATIEQEIRDRAEGAGLSPTLSDEQREEIMNDYATARLEWRSWLGGDFLGGANSSVPADAGIRGAITGTLWVLLFAMLFAAPLGVGAALYLEEYAKDSAVVRNPIVRRFNTFVETNIRNLAGVPSIIYGLLGLAIFARVLEAFTSGSFLEGVIPDFTGNANGRTVLSAGLTLGLLILPVIIINAQEAIRAVPNSIREASYGLGATKWQTIWRQVLPAALPGIMTGFILSLSRAIGETAPLVVVGAAVFLSKDPNGPFVPFTTLPIQVYNWASQPSDQFRNASSSAIIVLLVMLLILNASAIIIRQRFSRRLQ